jgi:hypothetical protein
MCLLFTLPVFALYCPNHYLFLYLSIFCLSHIGSILCLESNEFWNVQIPKVFSFRYNFLEWRGKIICMQSSLHRCSIRTEHLVVISNKRLL